MCIIAIKPKGKKMFTKEIINNMFQNNPNGAGYMYYDTKIKKVIIKKGFMSSKALYNDLCKKDFKDTNVILHFRISTSGLVDALNTHPYPVYDKNKVYCETNLGIVHNGILKAYEPARASKINDTQAFIQSVLKPLKHGWTNNNDILSLIKTIIGDSNKLALLDDNNKITMIGNFIEDKGYFYSNTTYLRPMYYSYCGGYTFTKHYAEELDEDDSTGIWTYLDNKYNL